MSPELLQSGTGAFAGRGGGVVCSPETDVYSFGIVLSWLWTGNRPYGKMVRVIH